MSALQGLQVIAGSLTLTASQEVMRQTILSQFAAAGVPGPVADAAVVNAYAESRLRPDAASPPPEDSVGLFQLNAAAGAAGQGMTREQRADPVQNCQRIILIYKGSAGAALRSALMAGTTRATLTTLWARDIERCRECGHSGGSAELDRRAATCRALYGPAADETVRG